ncbi:MAG TPA: diphthine--ammonia ligase [Candidatus Nanoarchaeia archaeon]|nr:diphthine--ammonia ligase [Candidatus Nanoarchaeia archaeon]
MKLGALFSGGKDSTFALYKAAKKDDVVCLISLISKNPESYMFHTPNIHLVELQAESIGLPLILEETEGKKEEELKDLKKAIKKAKTKYKIEGIVTGAFASNYQKERIQNICDELSLECISPLWSENPEILFREMIDNGFEIILSSISAMGFDESWLGRVLSDKDIDQLVKLNKKVGIHIAFEGGEAESLVLKCPIFNQRIKIVEAEKKMENEHTGIYNITKAELEQNQEAPVISPVFPKDS